MGGGPINPNSGAPGHETTNGEVPSHHDDAANGSRGQLPPRPMGGGHGGPDPTASHGARGELSPARGGGLEIDGLGAADGARLDELTSGSVAPPTRPALIDLGDGVIARRAELSVEMHRGPIPDPRTLADYGVIDPRLPDRIVTMAEKSLDANIAQANRANRAEASAVRIGGATPMVSIVGSFVVAIVALTLGRELVAGIFGAGGIALTIVPRVIAEIRRKD